MHSAIIKRSLLINERLAGVSVLGCLMYTWAHCMCDDYGRLSATPGWWAMRVVPGRGALCDVEAALGELVQCGALIAYSVGDGRFVRIADWFETQSWQELHMMRAECPNPETGELEQSMLWKYARDHFGLRKRAPKRQKRTEHEPEKITVKNEEITVRLEETEPVTVKNEPVTVKDAALYSIYDNSSNAGETGDEPVGNYWDGCDDLLVVHIAETFASVPKYANASRPPTLARVTELVHRLREIAPHDEAIRDMVKNWHEFHEADKKAKYGKSDPVASMRGQIGHYEPKWTVQRSKLKRIAETETSINHNRRGARETMADELARITGGNP